MLKLRDEKIVIVRVGVLSVRDWYIKVISENSTTKGFTGQVLYAMYQLGWSVNMRIVHDSHHGILEHIINLL